MTDPVFAHQGRNVSALALLYAFRMLGLFMVLPVLVLYADDYRGSSPFLMGLALGAYGFSQALLQIPFGMWSDRWGRKPVIAAGLLIFAAGSVIAAVSESIEGLILGRFLQGAGAIASALMAMVADLTRDENRTKAMAAIGAAIGLSFSVALVLGPVVSRFAGLDGIFWLTAGFALVGLAILVFVLPSPQARSSGEATPKAALIRTVLGNRDLLRLDWGILVLHFVLMANFVVLPRVLSDVLLLDGTRHWTIYLPLLGGAFVAMLPFMVLAEKKGRVKGVFLGAVGLLAAMQVALALGHQSGPFLLAWLFLFFMAFNLLEANLPSLVSKTVPGDMRGTANGIYSTSQFAGAFLGGAMGGAVLSWGGVQAVFWLCALAAALWWLVALFMTVPRPVSSILVPLREPDRDRVLGQLLALPGVDQVDWLEQESAARLTVDRRVFRRERIAELGLE
ncbi:MFS transporter [Gilvimarinus sp. F26214L]|uniref:MFS transporter n=1 Tax=Gilvimarinus sp. DZF01 TaxID=3461371 RepID=UPI004045B8BD